MTTLENLAVLGILVSFGGITWVAYQQGLDAEAEFKSDEKDLHIRHLEQVNTKKGKVA